MFTFCLISPLVGPGRGKLTIVLRPGRQYHDTRDQILMWWHSHTVAHPVIWHLFWCTFDASVSHHLEISPSRNLSDGNEWLVPAWEYCHSWADPGLSGCGASGSGDIGVSESGGHVMAWHQSQHGNNVTRVSRRLSHHITSWEQRYWSHLISQNAMKRLTVKHKVSVLLLVWSLKCFLNLNVEVSTNW